MLDDLKTFVSFCKPIKALPTEQPEQPQTFRKGQFTVIDGICKGTRFNGRECLIAGELRVWNEDSHGQSFPAVQCEYMDPVAEIAVIKDANDMCTCGRKIGHACYGCVNPMRGFICRGCRNEDEKQKECRYIDHGERDKLEEAEKEFNIATEYVTDVIAYAHIKALRDVTEIAVIKDASDFIEHYPPMSAAVNMGNIIGPATPEEAEKLKQQYCETFPPIVHRVHDEIVVDCEACAKTFPCDKCSGENFDPADPIQDTVIYTREQDPGQWLVLHDAQQIKYCIDAMGFKLPQAFAGALPAILWLRLDIGIVTACFGGVLSDSSVLFKIV